MLAFEESSSQVGIANPGLGPLEDNDGPTATHALLESSPAVDRGPEANPDDLGLPMYDQRGEPFVRDVEGVIDIGAFEFGTSFISPTQQSASADFNGDGVVDGFDLYDPDQGLFARWGEDLSGNDFLSWQRQVDTVFAAVGGSELQAASAAEEEAFEPTPASSPVGQNLTGFAVAALTRYSQPELKIARSRSLSARHTLTDTRLEQTVPSSLEVFATEPSQEMKANRDNTLTDSEAKHRPWPHPVVPDLGEGLGQAISARDNLQ